MDDITRLRALKQYATNGISLEFTYSRPAPDIVNRIMEIVGFNRDNLSDMELSLRIMNYVFLTLKPGNADYPKVKNECHTLNILMQRNNFDIECNCLMYSVVMSEILLSYGIKAKVIICRPFDFYTNSDCHCVVQAFIRNYNKWIAFDPSNNAAFRHSGKFLSVPEIRTCLTKEDNIVVFGARINSPTLQILKSYLAKYFVVFSCLKNNTYNCHSGNLDNEIRFLLPLIYKSEPTITTAYKRTSITYYDEGFWKG